MNRNLQPIAESLKRNGFAFAEAEAMQRVLGEAGLADWESFAKSWDHLGIDSYMADGGRYRRRRHAAFAASSDGVARKPHQPHYQSRDYNPLNGGIERWFAPVAEAIGAHPAMRGDFADLLRSLRRPDAARHKAARLARRDPPVPHRGQGGREGRPTPEGLHQDGVDWVLVLLIARENVASGMTSIHDLANRNIGNFTLTQPFDAAFVDDSRVSHGVTPVEPWIRRAPPTGTYWS